MTRKHMCFGFVALGALLVGTGTLWELLVRDLYSATARVAVTQPQFNPGWFEIEIDRLRSKEVLWQVISKLELEKEWAKQRHLAGPLSMERAYEFLRQRVAASQYRSTSLIGIHVTTADRQEAARIANALAEVYRDIHHIGHETAAPIAAVEIIDTAEPPFRPLSRQWEFSVPLPVVGNLNLSFGPPSLLCVAGLLFVAIGVVRMNEPSGHSRRS